MKHKLLFLGCAMLAPLAVFHACNSGDGNGDPSIGGIDGGSSAGTGTNTGGSAGNTSTLTECQKIIVKGCERIYACLDASARKEAGFEGTQSECVYRGFARCVTNSACPEGTRYDHTKSPMCLAALQAGTCNALADVDFVPDECWARCACKGVPEICNGIDDNCNGMTDEGLPQVAIYEDGDGDGYGNPDGQMKMGCGAVEGWGVGNKDCDDANPEIYPTGKELCNSIDDNCNGIVDDNAQPTCGIGDCKVSGSSCERANECVPGRPTFSKELCDSADNDCDGQTDEESDKPCGTRIDNICIDGECVPMYSVAAVPGRGRPYPYLLRQAAHRVILESFRSESASPKIQSTSP